MNLKMTVTEINSTTISRLEWAKFGVDVIENINTITGYLRATFKNGTRYIYEDVPLTVAMAIMNPSGGNYSIGSNFNEHIKSGNYKYSKE